MMYRIKVAAILLAIFLLGACDDSTSNQVADAGPSDAADLGDVDAASDAGDGVDTDDAGESQDVRAGDVEDGSDVTDAADALAGDAAQTGDATQAGDATQETPYECHDPSWTPPACSGSTVTEQPDQGGDHVPAPTPITYTYSPPASGPHRPRWGKWGEYVYLPAEHWVHNLEHGGVALLYNPCADAAVVTALHTYAASRPDDEGGQFRWVLTPYPGLSTTVAVVAWDWVYEANCVDEASIEAFVSEHYRQAPEDAASDGTYTQDWLGR